jgi:Tol biopolymer transport system component/imidazolonepropionase-like amidohydrolase
MNENVGSAKSLAAATLAAFLLLFCSAPAAAQIDDWQTIEFETAEVTDPELTVSPDGATLVFTMLGHLFRLSVDGGEAEQLTFGPYWDSEPAFSPDGRRVAFISDRDGGEGSVFVLELSAGQMTQVTNEEWVSRPTWSPDGESIAYLSLSGIREGCPDDSAVVRRVAIGGGESETVSASPGLIGSLFNLTDGRLAWTVLVESRFPAEPKTRIAVLNGVGLVSSVDTLLGEWNQVVPDPRGEGFYGLRSVHVRDLGIRPFGDAVLLHVSPSGGVDNLFASLPSPYCPAKDPRFAVSPDGGALYVGDSGHLIKITVSDEASEHVDFHAMVSMEVRLPVEPPRLALADPGSLVQQRSVLDPRLAPDGRSLVFGALGYLWEQPLDGRPARRLLEGNGFERKPAFAPDGSKLAFVHSQYGEQQVRVLDLASRQTRTLDSGSYFGRPSWSPDGGRLVIGKRERGRWRVLALDLRDGGSDVLRSIGSEYWLPRPHISPDGRFLYYSGGAEDTGTLFRLPLAGTPNPQPVTQPPRHVQEGLVCPDERCVVYRRNEEIWVAPMVAGECVTREARLLSPDGGQTFGLVPDRSAVIYAAGNRIWVQDLDSGEREEIPFRLELENRKPAPLLIRGVRLLDFASGGFGAETSVFIEGGRIRWIGPEDQHQLPSGTTVLDGNGRYAIPGLFDMHVHVEAFGGEFDTNQEAFIAYGVTSVRDMGERLSWVQALADRSEATSAAVPRYFFPGEVFEPAHPGHRGWGLLLDGAEDVRQYMGRWKERGVQFVKTHHAPGTWLLDRAVAEESRRLGLPLAGDPGAGTEIGEIARYVSWGYAFIEHTIQMPTRLQADVLELMARAGTRWVPTVGVMGTPRSLLIREDPRRLEDPKLRAFVPEAVLRTDLTWAKYWPWRTQTGVSHEFLANIREADRRGVKLQLGSDTYGDGRPGSSLALEMELFAEAGLEPVEVLRLASQGAAEALGVGHELGTLEPEKLADIVLLDANPLEDIKNTQAIWRVIKGGWVFDPEELQPKTQVPR